MVCFLCFVVVDLDTNLGAFSGARLVSLFWPPVFFTPNVLFDRFVAVTLFVTFFPTARRPVVSVMVGQSSPASKYIIVQGIFPRPLVSFFKGDGRSWRGASVFLRCELSIGAMGNNFAPLLIEF